MKPYQRRRLIDLQGENGFREAASGGKALEEEARYQARVKQLQLDVYTAVDSRKVLALAMNDPSQNASRIGNLTITSEILATLLNDQGADANTIPD